LTAQMQSQLVAELKGALAAEGPAGAIGVCHHVAPMVAAGLAEDNGWRVGRTALRIRNPANAPTGDERGILLGYMARQAGGQDPSSMETIRIVTEADGRQFVHYMKAIPMGEPCLACHGTEIESAVKDRVAELYPDDQATGFAVGDIRGAFTLYKPIN